MIISVNWLKKYTDITLPIDELTSLIGERLVEIEGVVDLGARYRSITIARIAHVYSHPNADKLHVVEIDDGGVVADVSRLENGFIQVVCGAPNVRQDMLVAWIPPGATVPASFTEAEPFVLSARELRGVMSNGMLASGKELAINNDHDGIAEIEGGYHPGASFAESFELNDYLLDIENKSLTHRPDCFGVIGFAREVAAIQGKPFRSPDWLLATEPRLAEVVSVEGIRQPTITIEDAQLCARYEAVVIANVDSHKQSPLVIQSYLKRVGIRPISAVVDVTNYLMLTTGHPLHAFDYDALMRVQGDGDEPHITVRSARKGEQLKLLDKRTVTLSEGDIVICTGEVPVGLAGAMGGVETEVTTATKNILVESATFNLYNLRTTSMRHGIFSDAVTRFTKGQAAEQTAPVLASATRMLCDIAGGQRASEIVDVYPARQEIDAIPITISHINATLGAELSAELIKQTLISIECTVTPGDDDALLVTPPYWRADMHIPEDIIEEIGRLRGFSTLIPVLPVRPYVAVRPGKAEIFREKMRHILVRAGSNEVLTYSFIPEKLMMAAGQTSNNAYRVVNALSPELQFYRTSLLPSVLDKVNQNVRSGFDSFGLFEFNKVHIKGMLDDNDNNLPQESYRLAHVIAASDKAALESYRGAPYYQARHYADYVLRSNHVNYRMVQLAGFSDETEFPAQWAALAAPFEPKRSAVIVADDGVVIGVVGEFKKSVASNLKLPVWCAGFELLLEKVMEVSSDTPNYKPLSKYPGTERDVCLRVAREIYYQQLLDAVSDELKNHPFESQVTPVDIYQKTRDDEFKQITIKLSLTDQSKTITATEANDVVLAVAKACQQLGAELV